MLNIGTEESIMKKYQMLLHLMINSFNLKRSAEKKSLKQKFTSALKHSVGTLIKSKTRKNLWKLYAANPSKDSLLWSGIANEKFLTTWMKTLMDVSVLRKIYIPKTQETLTLDYMK